MTRDHRAGTRGAGMRVEVDRIACRGHGLCAALFGERITLDEWGYPILDARPVPGTLLPEARAAVAACPALALHLARTPAYTDHV